ncbi:MAG: ferredoxin [Candidatus Omnitrophica bacterium]|nr:ferredoxin [Candidatus Omnitrophota bacterium]
MKVVIDNETCIGCGLCAQVAPNVYEMQGDKAVSILSEISEDMGEEAKNGAEQCPVSAIVVS